MAPDRNRRRKTFALALLLAAGAGCDHAARGWRGNMTGDYAEVASCAAAATALSTSVRREQTLAIVAAEPREAAGTVEAHLRETAPGRFFAEVAAGSGDAAGLALWQAIRGCAAGGPRRIWPPETVSAALP